MTPEQLFDFANGFARRAETAGAGTTYPTFRDAAKRFKVRHDEIEQACQDWDQSGGYMQPAVGVGGSGGATAFACRGDWLVEAYR